MSKIFYITILFTIEQENENHDQRDVSGMSNFSGMFIGLDGTISFGGSVLKPTDGPITGGPNSYYPAAMVLSGD